MLQSITIKSKKKTYLEIGLLFKSHRSLQNTLNKVPLWRTLIPQTNQPPRPPPPPPPPPKHSFILCHRHETKRFSARAAFRIVELYSSRAPASCPPFVAGRGEGSSPFLCRRRRERSYEFSFLFWGKHVDQRERAVVRGLAVYGLPNHLDLLDGVLLGEVRQVPCNVA